MVRSLYLVPNSVYKWLIVCFIIIDLTLVLAIDKSFNVEHGKVEMEFTVDKDGILRATNNEESVSGQSSLVPVKQFEDNQNDVYESDFALVCTIDGAVHGVDLHKNEEKWSLQFGDSLVKSFNSIETTKTGAVVPGDDGMLYIYTKNNKLEQYELSIPELVELSPMIQELNGGHRLVVVGERNTKTLSVNPVTGKIFLLSSSSSGVEKTATSDDFKFEFGQSQKESSSNKNTNEERLIIGRVDYHVRAFDEITQQEVWNFTYGEFELLGMQKEISNIYKFADNSMNKGMKTSSTQERITYNRVPISAFFGVDFQRSNFMSLSVTAEKIVDNQRLLDPFRLPLDPEYSGEHSLQSLNAFNDPSDAKEAVVHVLAFNHSYTRSRQVFASMNVAGNDLFFHLNQNKTIISYTDDDLITSQQNLMLEGPSNSTNSNISNPDKVKFLPYDDPEEDGNVCPLDMTGEYRVTPVKPRKTEELVEEVEKFYNNFLLLVMTISISPIVVYLVHVWVNKAEDSNLKDEDKVPNKYQGMFATENYVDASTVKVNDMLVYLNQVKGRGGNGTIVFKGKLDDRLIAVKRILRFHQQKEQNLVTEQSSVTSASNLSASKEKVANREIEILIKSDGHPNVVRYFTKEISHNFVYLALELCEMSLDKAISLKTKALTILQTFAVKIGMEQPLSVSDSHAVDQKFLLEIADAVRHLHDSRIIHRDIKPQNVLVIQRSDIGNKQKLELFRQFKNILDILEAEGVNKTTKELLDDFSREWFKLHTLKDLQVLYKIMASIGTLWLPKISDMGLSKIVDCSGTQGGSSLATVSTNLSFQHSIMQTIDGTTHFAAPGTHGWRAPELLLGKRNTNISLSKAIDIFALGNLFFYYFTDGSHPYGQPLEREKNIRENHIPHLHEVKIRRSILEHDLIEKMISFDPEHRLTVKEITWHISMWEVPKISEFLCFLSGRLRNQDSYTSYLKSIFDAKAQGKIFTKPWMLYLNQDLRDDLRATNHVYCFNSSSDLLRFFRNKTAHVFELEKKASEFIINSSAMLDYFNETFPNFVIFCYNFVLEHLAHEESYLRFLGKSVVKENSSRSCKIEKSYKKFNIPPIGNKLYYPTKEYWIQNVSFLCTSDSQPDAENVEFEVVGNHKRKKNANNTKTSLCKHFQRTNGTWCPKGKSCGYAHSPVELKVNSVFNFYFKR